MKKGIIFSIIGCILSSVGVFMEMHSDKEEIRGEFRETYEDEVRRIIREEKEDK